MIVSSPQNWVTRMRIDEDAVKALADAIRGYTADNTTVLGVRTKIDIDPDEGDHLTVQLILTDPPEGELTWSREASRAIRAEARAQAAKRGFTWDNTAIALIDIGGLRAIDPAAVEDLE
jgi:hypothetical protein